MFTYINRLNGQSYDVMLYDSETNVALLHPINNRSNNYLIVENLNLNGNGLGDNVVSFDDYNEARNYFVLNQYNSLDYKTQFINILKEEDINIDNVNLDSLYARWMDDSSITGFIDRESIERIVEEEKEERSGSSYNSANFNDEQKNKQILEKTIGVFTGYRIAKPKDENDKGIYVVLVDDLVRDGGINENIEITFEQMKELVPEDEQYYYSSYGVALDEWTKDIRQDINDLGLYFPDGEKEVYDFYLTPEELLYCGLGLDVKEQLLSLSNDERIKIANISNSQVILEMLSLDNDEDVRYAVAHNINTSHETLDNLSLDKSKEISNIAQSTDIAKYNSELNHINELFDDNSIEYFIYENDKQQVKVIWFNPDGNDGLGTIRVDYYPYTELKSILNNNDDKFYANDFYESYFNQFDHESITDLSKIDEIIGNNAIKTTTQITIREIFDNIEKNRLFDSKDFGNIIQDMVNIARTSDNNTWFLEVDDFIDGTYNQDDLDQLNKDIQKLRDLGVKDIDTIIEAYSDFDSAIESGESVATFYGSFLDLFEENEFESENKDIFRLDNILNDNVIINNDEYRIEAGDIEEENGTRYTNFLIYSGVSNNNFYAIQVVKDEDSVNVICSKYFQNEENGLWENTNWSEIKEYLVGDIKCLEEYFITRADFIESVFPVLRKVDPKIRSKAISLEAIQHDSDYYLDVPSSLINDDFNLECVKRNVFSIEYLKEDDMTEDIVKYVKYDWDDYIPSGTSFPKEELTANICAKSLINTSQWDFNRDVPKALQKEVVEQLLKLESIETLCDIASDKNTSIDVLLKLNELEDQNIKAKLKENPYYKNYISIMNDIENNKYKYPILKIIDELSNAIKDEIISLDPNNKNNVLVYREDTEDNQDGWYSMNIFEVASELASDDEMYKEFKQSISEVKDSQSLVDKINEIDDELSNTLDSIQSLEDDEIEI